MTESERTDLIELYVDGELPDALRANVEAHLAAHPEASANTATLISTKRRLQAMPTDRPDTWFVERTLDRLLQEHAADCETEMTGTIGSGRH